MFRVLKQLAVGALRIVSALFPDICFSFELPVLLYFPALSGPHCEADLPKEKRMKKEISGPLKLWSGSNVLQYFLFAPPVMRTYTLSYSTFFLTGKTLAKFMTEEKKQERLIRDFSFQKMF